MRMTVEDFLEYSIEESWQKFTLYDVDNDIIYYTNNIESYDGVNMGTGEIYTNRSGNFEIKVISGKVYIDYLGA